MPFQSTKPKSHLLIPRKRPLSSPSHAPITTTTTATTAQPVLRSTRQMQSEQRRASPDQDRNTQPRRIEVDFSAAPQPFLDPALWERMRKGEAEAGRKREREREKEKEQEKEYGGLAVKRRIGGGIR
ncbi:hypothetical protein P175DRAFT_0498158 [Aspergillus ochraceoroseus IBT 24754]|uniref:Uncharacterized protein n=1 Tax=Aspergillus ochraceoroseus IBT 24754 TaxID=1392256 RepID=A0A2T5M944_9EURO|nr:uncharacterized protein P175DRAFT_0498158 [Aspergillus ochraceoroseus IBT 24754]PTU25047.1 hypothetical protein P175DRAFT_0498158 [Aspergillus ochraceoroseus IBT 24754]